MKYLLRLVSRILQAIRIEHCLYLFDKAIDKYMENDLYHDLDYKEQIRSNATDIRMAEIRNYQYDNWNKDR